MGVQGLWELLAPVGRRVSVETLAGKKLAIDASIWIVQFMKAMRDERGEMVRHAHLLGFFRRICKLLFLSTKPVFVFDGGTPALKRRTVIARRRQRENAQAKIRKTAEKLLLNHLKTMRLKELANDIENQKQKNKSKGKNVVSESTQVNEDDSKRNDNVTGGYDQETLDELLAASFAAEEGRNATGNTSTSVGGIASEDDDGDGDEEMILPVMHGKVDPSVLAALPPSMQLDLLVQMRESLMAENRQKYQKVNKVPAKFSELQIKAYLKTVAFRREIDEVQKSAAGKGVGGVRTSRIASEANREYIFSTSFTGDRQILTSPGVENNGVVEGGQTLGKEPISSAAVNNISSTARGNPVTVSGIDAISSGLDDDVETYLDERGRLRVSRVRAMGIRMTRDLQRNLDLMKEIEQEKTKKKTSSVIEAIANKNVFGGPESFPVTDHVLEDHEALEKKTAMEISFFEDDNGRRGTDGDDDLFAHLVAGSPVNISYAKKSPSVHSFATTSDCSWEEGIVEEKDASFNNDVEEQSQISLAKGNISYENEVDWEEGVCDVPRNASSCPMIHNQDISRGSLEEEADIQEAIRRSLEDITKDKSIISSTENENIEISIEVSSQGTRGFTFQALNIEKDRIASLNLPVEKELVQSQTSEAVAGDVKLDHGGERDILQIIDSPDKRLGFSEELEVRNDEKSTPMHRLCEGDPVSGVGVLREEAIEYRSVQLETPCRDLVTPVEPNRDHLIADQCLDTSTKCGRGTSFAVSNCSSKISSHGSAAVMDDVPEVILVDANRNNFEAAPTCHSCEAIENANSQERSPTKELTDVGRMQNQVTEKNSSVLAEEVGRTGDNSVIQDNMEDQMEVSEASLDEEMLFLRQVRIDLGDEQRKLERNAESVSSEMFAECQELLQMFGIPYIIAPMEAEAQCAYMELANFVDGVVTDDSDVFLFGARSVYKNIFDDRKYVETYFMKDIESELGLTREQLIRMALLLGSDYTEGVSGIGIVNAIEVVHAFPEEDGLQKFREWLESPDPTILGKLDAQTGCGSRKRGSKVSNDDVGCSKNNIEGGFGVDRNVSQDHDEKQSVDETQSIKKIFMDKHRNVSKNWHIPSSFPSETVISAYASPQVDKSTESFSWGKPDLFVLRKLCWEKFGWSNPKADELLVPVLKEYNKHETQLRLEAFYTFNERFAKIRSRRIKKAVKGITGNQSAELMDDLPQEASRARKKRRAGSTGPKGNKSDDFPNGVDGIAGNTNNSKKSTPRRSRTGNEPMLTEVGHSGPPFQKECKRNARKGLSKNVKGNGRGTRSRVERGKRKEATSSESTETSSCDGRDDKNELDMKVEKTEGSSEVRRSTRPRKHIKYTANDSEIDGLREPSDERDGKCTDGVAVEQELVRDQDMSGDAASGFNEKGGDSFPKDGFCREYLEMGGRFCLDQDEQESGSIHLVASPTRPSDMDGIDYLTMGGGFCMDEGEPSTDPVQSVSRPSRDPDESLNGGRMDAPSTTWSPDSPNNKGEEDPSNVSVPLEEEKQELQKAESTTGLTAMPFLRRKRRKT